MINHEQILAALFPLVSSTQHTKYAHLHSAIQVHAQKMVLPLKISNMVHDGWANIFFKSFSGGTFKIDVPYLVFACTYVL